MNKDKYESPYLEKITVISEDIITSSVTGDNDSPFFHPTGNADNIGTWTD